MATHSSVLAWRIPRTEEAGGLQSMGSQRVGHDWASDTTTDADVGAEGLSPTLGRGLGLGPESSHAAAPSQYKSSTHPPFMGVDILIAKKYRLCYFLIACGLVAKSCSVV